MENFTFRDACRRKIKGKIVAFLSTVVYYSGDLLKSANMAFVRHKTFISLQFECFSSSLLILGDFKVTRCVLVEVITSSSVQTRNSALESKYQQLYQTKTCATIPKIKLKQFCRCHLPPSNISMQNFYRNGKLHVQRDACRRKIDGKIVAFLSPVICYFGYLLKSVNRAFVRRKTFVSL